MPSRGTAILCSCLALASLLYCCAAVNLSWIQRHHTSDTLLLGLISTEHYRLFYWGANRYGTLLPLLALPVKPVFYNLLWQTQMGVAIFALLAYAVVILGTAPRRIPVTSALLRTCLVLLICLAVFRDSQTSIHLAFLGNSTLPSLLLTLAGLLLLTRRVRPNGRRRYVFAMLSFAVAFWVNITSALVALGYLLFAPSRLLAARRKRLADLAGVAAVACCSYLFSSLFSGDNIRGFVGPGQAAASLANLLRNSFATVFRPWPLLALAALALALRVARGQRRCIRAAGIRQLPLWLACAAYAVLIPFFYWVKHNKCDARYLAMASVPAVLLLASNVAGLLLNLLRGRVSRPLLLAGSALALTVSVTAVFGVPSLQGALARLDDVTSPYVPGAERLECTHMVGSYWLVWPMVVNQRHHRAGPPLFAISDRSEDTRGTWDAIPAHARTYCGICPDEDFELHRSRYGLPEMIPARRDGGVCSYETRSQGRASASGH